MANIYDMVDTWNDGATTFTAIKMDVTDTASASDSLLMDLQVGGSSKFSVDKAGDVTARGQINVGASVTAVGIVNSTGTSRQLRFHLQDDYVALFRNDTQPGLSVRNTDIIGWSQTSSPSLNKDVRLYRDAAGTLAQRNGTNAQTFNLYNTYTDASNYERGFMKWNSNVLEIGTEAAGTGSATALALVCGQNKGVSVKNYLGATSVTFYPVGSNELEVRLGSTPYYKFDTSRAFKVHSGNQFAWGSVNAGSSADTGLARDSAGVVKVTDGSTGTGELIADAVFLGANQSPAVKTDTTGVTGADAVTNVISLTQAEYDAITPDAATLYVITT